MVTNQWLILPYSIRLYNTIRPGLLNPTTAFCGGRITSQKGPSPEQNNLLTSRLIGSNSDLLEVTGPDLPLCEVMKCQLCEVTKMVIPCLLSNTAVDFRLCDTVRPTLDMAVGFRLTFVMVTRFKSFENIEAGHFIELVRFIQLLERKLKRQFKTSILSYRTVLVY